MAEVRRDAALGEKYSIVRPSRRRQRPRWASFSLHIDATFSYDRLQGVRSVRVRPGRLSNLSVSHSKSESLNQSTEFVDCSLARDALVMHGLASHHRARRVATHRGRRRAPAWVTVARNARL